MNGWPSDHDHYHAQIQFEVENIFDWNLFSRYVKLNTLNRGQSFTCDDVLYVSQTVLYFGFQRHYQLGSFYLIDALILRKFKVFYTLLCMFILLQNVERFEHFDKF